MDTPPVRSVIASPEGTFLSLLFQKQSAAPEGPSNAISNPAESFGKAPAAGVEAIPKNPFLSVLRTASVEPETAPKRKKAPSETDTGALAFAAQSPAMSKPAPWMLSLTCSEAQAPGSPPSSSSVPAAQPLTALSRQLDAATTLPVECTPKAANGLLIEATTSRDAKANAAASGATPGTATPGTMDAAPFAELSLTPSAAPTVASRSMTPKSDPSLTPDQAPSSTRLPESAEARPRAAVAIESPGGPAVLRYDLGQRNESSLDSSPERQTSAPAATKKKAEVGGSPSETFKILPDPQVSDQTVAPSTTVPGAPESQRAGYPSEPPTTASSVPEPTAEAPPKPAGSSVGTVELRIESPDRSSIGLRFVERQGRVEIQMNSGDQRTARALSENLDGLKSSLIETGWDVESRTQTRITPVGSASETVATENRGSAPSAEYQSSNLSSTRFSFDLPLTAPDRSSSSPPHPLEQVSNAQISRQSGSDSSASQDQSRPDRNDQSGRNGHHGRNDNASADSGGQGRQSARASEAWLESMEGGLTHSSAVGVTTGVTK